ncbi:unnamed protein product [Brassicogethes aeneus]|uniref:Uncharacterized protein n=1 Tax=Brassicogethes aeneus TaxID=1431903 RepID=A0A9P0B4B3_BRAAE|nr:unnamed protein product [Brassicogethes aeneus]
MSLESLSLRLRNPDTLTLEPNKMYLVDPLMVLPQNSTTDCAMFYNAQTSSNENCKEVNEGLAMLEILYNNNQHDQPEFIDVNNLTDIVTSHIEEEKNVLNVSDDDDVVFVAEYRNDDIKGSQNSDGEVPRRNPVRKVRNSRAASELKREVYYEEDFAFLEQQDELEEMNRKMTSYIKKQQVAVENYKQWPINVHERPEFNEETKKIERFDYTIRKIKETLPNKKPKLVKIPKPAKKKRYFLRRRRLPKIVIEKKVPIKDLSGLVDSTFDLVKGFLKESEECKRLVSKSKSNADVIDIEKEKLVLLKNQALLNSIVNAVEKCKITETFIASSKS